MIAAVNRKFKASKAAGRKLFALLVDPDKVTAEGAAYLANAAEAAKVDFLFVGGSLLLSGNTDECVRNLKKHCSIPVVLFPGSVSHLSSHADALLYLSLISGRNPELLIGQHVISAPAVRNSGLELLPTGYMIIHGGAPTTVSYISNASPIPSDKFEIAVCTAMAGEMLGLQLIFMDAGSGAPVPISDKMISKVSAAIDIPLIVGGGLKDAEAVYRSAAAGANVIVVGDAVEKDPTLIAGMAEAAHAATKEGRMSKNPFLVRNV